MMILRYFVLVFFVVGAVCAGIQKSLLLAVGISYCFAWIADRTVSLFLEKVRENSRVDYERILQKAQEDAARVGRWHAATINDWNKLLNDRILSCCKNCKLREKCPEKDTIDAEVVEKK